MSFLYLFIYLIFFSVSMSLTVFSSRDRSQIIVYLFILFFSINVINLVLVMSQEPDHGASVVMAALRAPAAR